MPKRAKKTWKEVAAERREANFVGRAEEMRVFRENFAGEDPHWLILSVTGEGGVGKSTLLLRYREIAGEPEIGANVVLCDDRHLFPVEVMGAVAEQLTQLDITSKAFAERYKKYLETRQQIERDPSAPRGMIPVVTRGLTDFTIKSMRRAPGVGTFMDYVDEQAAGQAMAELAQYAITRWGNKDEVQLVREPEKILSTERARYGNETWHRLEGERLYHLLSAAPEAHWPLAVQSFLPAFLYRWRFAGNLGRVTSQVIEETRRSDLQTRSAMLHTLVTAFENDEYDEVLSGLNALQPWLGEDPLARKSFCARRGLAYGLMGKYAESLADFDRALQLDEKSAWAIASRGQTYRAMGKYAESLADFDRALQLDDQMAWAIASRGETCHAMGKYAEALADFDRALQLDDQMAWAIRQRGVAYRALQKYR